MSASSPLYSTWFRRRNVSIQSTLLYMVKKKKCQHPTSPLYSTWLRRRNVMVQTKKCTQSTLLYMVKKKKCRHPVHSTLHGSDEEMSASSPLYSTWLRRRNVSIQSTLYSRWLREEMSASSPLYSTMVKKKKCQHPVHSTLHG